MIPVWRRVAECKTAAVLKELPLFLDCGSVVSVESLYFLKLSEFFLLSVRSVGRYFLGKFIGEGPVLAWMRHRPDDQSDAKQYERDAEQLSHVYAVGGNHLIFGSHLHVLYIFNKEAGQEDSDEEDSRDEVWSFLCILLPIHPHKQAEQKQIA